jgi:hypothetical protein
MNSYKLLPIVVLFLFSFGAAHAAPAQKVERQSNLPKQDASLYATDPLPLTLDQCGQCHPQHFSDLKQTGGKHQFDCRGCHTIFHAYNPLKDNYAAIIPQCGDCHDLVHGKKYVQCQSCHQNPHAAQKAPTLVQVENRCSDCHADQANQLATLPSRHTELSCSNCHHTQHGSIPSCNECHQPHFSTQSFTSCATCHAVHQPLAINLNQDIELQTCAVCHDDVFAKWQSTPSKHGQVNCSACHSAHKQIPQCADCHTVPASHSKKLLKKFPRCLDCHLDVHDLPVKKD